MTNTKLGPGEGRPCAAILASAAALFFAAPASADDNDGAFVTAIQNYGIDVNDAGTTIAHGHAVCAGLDKGQDSSFLAIKLMNDKELNLTQRQAGFFIGVSVAAYCPQYKGTLDPSLTWLVPFPPMM